MAEFFIKASEAARRIGVSLVTVKRMIHDGRLSGEKIGSRWQVLEQSVSDFLNKKQEDASGFVSVSDQNGDQKPIVTDADSDKTFVSNSVEPFVGDIDRSSVEFEKGAKARARAIGNESFPEHPLLVDEFGHMFGAIQFDADQFFVNCLRFIDDHLWFYWRPSSSRYALEELSYHLKASAPVVDLLSMSLFDVVRWVISRNVYGGSQYNDDDYGQGMWRVELRRASSKDADNDQLYRRCAYSFPFEFRSGSYEGQEVGIFPIENGVTEIILGQMNEVLLNGS